MLKKELRVTSRKEFKEIRENGVMTSTPLFGFLWLKSDSFRVGYIVSKKISKKAVDRNRIRRLVSEVIRLNMPTIGVRGLVLVKQSIKEKSLKEIEAVWKEMILRLKVE